MVLTRIRRVLDAFACSPEADQVDALARWLADLASWNQKVDLTAARDDDELLDLMLADAALLTTRLASEQTLVDVGSGAGAPGLPLAILRPDLDVTLVEPMQKRSAFLRLMLGRLGLDNARVAQRRLEAVDGPFDVAFSRATLAPTDWLAQGARLAPWGTVWVLLAREPAPQLAGWEVVADERYRWPLTGAERRAVSYRSEAG